MSTIPIGPLALPVAPLLVGAALFAAQWLAGRISADPVLARRAQWDLNLATLVALLASRAAFVLIHLDAFAASPWSVLDLRDGGWHPAGGVVGAGLWVLWRVRRDPPRRRVLGLAALAGVAMWTVAHVGLGLLAGSSQERRAPALTLNAFPAGEPKTLPALVQGQPTVVNLWATWCGPCRAEMPTLAQAQRRETGVRFLFVNQGEGPDPIRAYLQREGLALQDVWLDPTSALGPAVGSAGLPTTLFYDAQGRLVDTHVGVLSDAVLRVRLSELQRR